MNLRIVITMECDACAHGTGACFARTSKCYPWCAVIKNDDGSNYSLMYYPFDEFANLIGNTVLTEANIYIKSWLKNNTTSEYHVYSDGVGFSTEEDRAIFILAFS